MTKTLAAANPAETADAGVIRLGGAFRLPQDKSTADSGKIRLGGAFRLLPASR